MYELINFGITDTCGNESGEFLINAFLVRRNIFNLVAISLMNFLMTFFIILVMKKKLCSVYDSWGILYVSVN